MNQLQLWQLKQMAIVVGEHVVERKKNQLDVLMNYLLASKSKTPFEVQRKAEDEFSKPIRFEPEFTKEEIEQDQLDHNLNVLKEFFDLEH
jgi:hypothetical protein